jgi:hypothetical protein
MHIAAVITVCLAGTVGGGFVMAALITLLLHDDAEAREFQKEYAEASRRGPWHAYMMHWRVFRVSWIISHWKTRPEARIAVWVGLVASAIAVVAAEFM